MLPLPVEGHRSIEEMGAHDGHTVPTSPLFALNVVNDRSLYGAYQKAPLAFEEVPVPATRCGVPL
jgi:hypothetical protein